MRLRKLSKIPSAQIFRKVDTSPSAKLVYICLWSATAVGVTFERDSFIVRLKNPFFAGDASHNTNRETRSRTRDLTCSHLTFAKEDGELNRRGALLPVGVTKVSEQLGQRYSGQNRTIYPRSRSPTSEGYFCISLDTTLMLRSGA